MVKIKLNCGFTAEISEGRLDDMYFLEALAATEADPLKLSQVCSMLFGEEQKKALYRALETDDGRVPLDAVTDAIAETMEKGGEELKNS